MYDDATDWHGYLSLIAAGCREKGLLTEEDEPDYAALAIALGYESPDFFRPLVRREHPLTPHVVKRLSGYLGGDSAAWFRVSGVLNPILRPVPSSVAPGGDAASYCGVGAPGVAMVCSLSCASTAACAASAARPFAPAMLEAFLARYNYKYLVSPRNGDIVIRFDYDDVADACLTATFFVAGEPKEAYQITVENTLRVPRADWDRYTALCNRWNATHVWPKAFLEIPKAGHETTTVTLEMAIPLAAGIHQELLEEVSRSALTSSVAFWHWIKDEDRRGAAEGPAPGMQ